MGNEYSEKEMRELLEIKSEIVPACKICGGQGHVSGKERIERCECLIRFKYISELYYSRIPKEYWNISLVDLKIDAEYKQTLRYYVKNINTAIKDGLGIIYSSSQRGIGKTTSMCLIGRMAIQMGYKVFYTIAQNIIDDRWTDEQVVLDRINNCDLFLIDELDKIVMANESNIPKQLENLLRGLLPNRKAIIICTNFEEKEIEEKFKIISLLRRYMKIIEMSGEDFSKKLESQWESRLEGHSIDYNDGIIQKEAKVFGKHGGASGSAGN